ncbi:MAG: hypothetical protein AAGK00_19270 [Pseudomonadota bacterium]
MQRWIGRIVLYAIFLAVMAAGVLAAAYYAGMRLPVSSNVVAFAFQNWNQTAEVEGEADYDASLVRRDDRIHITVDLAVPETVQRLQAYLDGGKTKLVECGQQQVFLHGMPDAELAVQDPTISLSGTVDVEMEGLLQIREGRRISAQVTMGHSATTVWAQLDSLVIEGLPDPLVEPVIRELARKEYTREQILALAAGGLSPELADLLSRYQDPLDLRFEDIIPGQDGRTVTLQAVLSIDESTAFSMIGDHLVDAGKQTGTALAAMFGVGTAHAQLPAGIGDALERMGGSGARDAIEGALQGRSIEDLIGDLADCRTAF